MQPATTSFAMPGPSMPRPFRLYLLRLRATGTAYLLCALLLSGTGIAGERVWAQGANTPGQSPLQRSKELVPTQGVLAGKTVYTNSFALVVGCGTYPNLPADKQLDFARKDALAMRALLIRSYGFLPDNVILLLDADATKNNIEQALHRFTDKRVVRSTDRLFVYFSGHGQTVTSSDGQTDGFLVPTDARINLDKPRENTSYESTCVSMQIVRAFLEDSPAQHCLVMADACFSGFLVRGKGTPLSNPALTTLLTDPAYQVLTAGARGQQAWEDPKLGNSVFTYACLQSLRDKANNEGSVTLTSELGAGVKRVVLNLTGGKQTPQVGNVRASEGEFLFVATAPQSVPEARSGLPAGSSGVFGRRVQAVETLEGSRSCYKKHEYVEAERLVRKALQLDPDYSDAYNSLGILNFEVKKDYSEAERLYRKALELDANNSKATNNLGNVYREVKKDYVEAERLYRKAIEFDATQSNAYVNLGIIYYNIKKEYAEAERLFKKGIEVDPNNRSAYTNFGVFNYNVKKDYVEAERLYRKAIELDPKFSSAYVNLGNVFYIKKDYTEAERLYKKGIELDPNNSNAYVSLGNIYYDIKKDYTEAERLYKKGVEADPNNSLPYVSLGGLNYNQKKDYVEAERLYKKAIEVNPNNSNAYNNLGIIYCNIKKDYVEAERLYRKAIELDPKFSSAYVNLGNVFYIKKDYTEAERLYKKGVESDPNNSWAYINFGVLSDTIKKDYTEAERLYKKVIELDPNNSNAYVNLGNLNYNQKKDYVEAERLYKKAIKVDPNNSLAYANLALALLQQGKRDEAVVAARHAQQLGLKDHPVYKELGF